VRSPLKSWLLYSLVASLFALAALMHHTELHIDPWRPSTFPFLMSGVALLGVRFGLPRTGWRHARSVARCAEYLGLFALISLIGAIASYPIAAMTNGYCDDLLQRIDEAMGFDWLALYRTIAAHPSLQIAETLAYRSIYITPALLLWHFAVTGQDHRAYMFLGIFWLAALITLASFSLMPAVGPFAYLWQGQIPYMPDSELWQHGLIPELRSHDLHVIDLGQLRGIVSAPSFHTAAAIIYMSAAWRMPSLRWPVICLNLLMLLSTPVEGTHYLIDMILGALVASSALLVGTFLRIEAIPAR
jgi:hypothetical protein